MALPPVKYRWRARNLRARKWSPSAPPSSPPSSFCPTPSCTSSSWPSTWTTWSGPAPSEPSSPSSPSSAARWRPSWPTKRRWRSWRPGRGSSRGRRGRTSRYRTRWWSGLAEGCSQTRLRKLFSKSSSTIENRFFFRTNIFCLSE